MGFERNRALRPKAETMSREVASAGLPLDALPPVDRAHLQRYTLGSLDLEREVLGLFLAQLPLSIEQLRFAATDREWQIAAHTIKGSAKAVGARHVARIATDAERTSGAMDEGVRSRVLLALEEACEAIEAYVADAFPPPLPAHT